MKIQDRGSVREKYRHLKKLTDHFSKEYRERFIGRTLTMVTEEKDGGYVSGYTENYIRVSVREKVELGRLVPVRICGFSGRRVLAARC
jgi:tRNA A37 methylthiotransferase MiaB